MDKLTRIRVRYAETDQMGVAYYANYFIWMEQARTEYLEHLGFSYKELEEQGYYLPVVEARASYKTPAKYDDWLDIKCLFTCEKVKIKVAYEIFRDSTKLADANTVHVFTDANGKPVRPPKALFKSINEISGRKGM